jgi:hypothetical protein
MSRRTLRVHQHHPPLSRRNIAICNRTKPVHTRTLAMHTRQMRMYKQTALAERNHSLQPTVQVQTLHLSPAVKNFRCKPPSLTAAQYECIVR